MRVTCTLALACLAAAPAHATDTWMSVMLDGQKVGKVHIQRDVADGKVTTVQSMDMVVTRFKSPMVSTASARMVESPAGSPLAFSASGGNGNQAMSVDAEKHRENVFQVASTVAGQSKVVLLNWPEGAVMAEGQRLAFASHGFVAGTTYRMRTFEPARQQVANVDVTVVGDELVDLPLGQERLHHLRQVLADSSGAQWTETWVDDQGFVRRSVSPMYAYRLEMAACDAACANAPNQDVDVLRAAAAPSPRMIPSLMRFQPIRYVVSVDGNHPDAFLDTDEQRVRQLSDGLYEIDVGGPRHHSDEPGPTDDDTLPNPWVQSDAPEIKEAALRIVGNASTDAARMRRLRSWMTDNVDQHGLDIAYASALDTLHDLRGDCTEHSVLLAALARSLGIPTRVVTGIVYVDRYGGLNRVFVPHAWVQAWVNGRWESFDSNLGRYDMTHLALGVGSGDPWRFFAATSTLGSIHIQRVVAASAMMNQPPESQRPDFPNRTAPSIPAPPPPPPPPAGGGGKH
jgi:hypothetical protein